MRGALRFLGLARKAGALVTGEENARLAVRSGRARLLVVSADASDNARKRAEDFVKGTNVPLAVLPLTKEDVSSATGRPGCSMAVFTDKGLAAAFLKALAAEYGEDYSPLAGLLG